MALNRYLTGLDETETKFDVSASEVVDIESAVVQVCYRILEEVYELDNRFKTSRVLKTGSFYDGTKIRKPNEFDLMAVNEELSRPGLCKAVRECPDAAGFAHVVTEDQSVADRWKGITYSREDGRLYIVPYHQFGSVQVRFGRMVRNAYERLCSRQRQRTISTPTGTLKMIQGGTNPVRPGCRFQLKWRSSSTDAYNPLYIEVDLTFAVEVEVENDRQSARNSLYLLVPVWCFECQEHSYNNITLCWRRSFSLIEKQMFEEMGHQHIHKRCNRVLKYLKDMFYLDTDPFQISSYVIKTLVLRHEEQYKEKEHKCLEKCVLRILHDLVHCCREKELQSLHNAKCNIFAAVGKRKLIATEKAIRLVIAALRQICERRIFRISACNELTERLRYDMKRFRAELRKEDSKTVQHCFLNTECEKWLCGLAKTETKTKAGERDSAKGVSQYPYRRGHHRSCSSSRCSSTSNNSSWVASHAGVFRGARF